MNEVLREHKTFFLIEGVLFSVLGFIAIMIPQLFTLGAEQLIGCLFVLTGLVQGFRTIKTGFSSLGITTFLLALIYLVVGVLLLIYPLQGIFSLTLLLTFFFALEGCIKIVLSLSVRPMQRWGWMLFSGVIALLMAIIIWAGWPSTALWVIGLLISINMLFFGFSLISWTLAANRV